MFEIFAALPVTTKMLPQLLTWHRSQPLHLFGGLGIYTWPVVTGRDLQLQQRAESVLPWLPALLQARDFCGLGISCSFCPRTAGAAQPQQIPPSCLQAQLWHKMCMFPSWDNRRWEVSDPLSSGLVALGALQSSISLPLLQICSALGTIKSQ